jgi:hypothetical protein
MLIACIACVIDAAATTCVMTVRGEPFVLATPMLKALPQAVGRKRGREITPDRRIRSGSSKNFCEDVVLVRPPLMLKTSPDRLDL